MDRNTRLNAPRTITHPTLGLLGAIQRVSPIDAYAYVPGLKARAVSSGYASTFLEAIA